MQAIVTKYLPPPPRCARQDRVLRVVLARVERRKRGS